MIDLGMTQTFCLCLFNLDIEILRVLCDPRNCILHILILRHKKIKLYVKFKETRYQLYFYIMNCYDILTAKCVTNVDIVGL